MADMPIRESAKLVEVNDLSYRVRKMPPWTATYLVKFVAAKLLPILATADAFNAPKNNVLDDNSPEGKAQMEKQKNDNEAAMTMLTEQLPKILDTITEDELKELMMKCLQYCDAMYLTMGPQAIINKHGSFGIVDIEYDFPLLLKLIIEVIKFNVGGFFGEGGFSIKGLTGLTSLSKQ